MPKKDKKSTKPFEIAAKGLIEDLTSDLNELLDIFEKYEFDKKTSTKKEKKKKK
jgi:hypothetical protein